MLTSSEKFSINYVKTSTQQAKMTEESFPRILEAIRNLYSQNKKPLSIAQFCCGYGRNTAQLLQQLNKESIPVERVVGYDLSHELIQYAQSNSSSDVLSFKQSNLECDFEEEQRYDVMIILFGLHWMNDMNEASKRIARSLKPGGLLFAMIYIDEESFHNARVQFSQKEKWNHWLNNFYLKPYRFQHKSYLEAFNNYFDSQVMELSEMSNQQNREELASKFRSFFVEVMNLVNKETAENGPKSAEHLAYDYLNEFVETIPENVRLVKKILGGQEYLLKVPILTYQGRKKVL